MGLEEEVGMKAIGKPAQQQMQLPRAGSGPSSPCGEMIRKKLVRFVVAAPTINPASEDLPSNSLVCLLSQAETC